MIEIKEVLFQWCQKRGKKTIARSLGLAKNTVKEIINQAESLGLNQDSDKLEAIAEALQTVRNEKKTNPKGVQYKINQYRDQIKEWLKDEHMTTTQMMRLLIEKGEVVSETSLRTYLKINFPAPKVSTIHLETIAGQCAQVDFGYVGLMVDPETSKAKKCYAFLMTLAHSRYKFLRFVFNQNSDTWLDCHIRAFEFFGGVPKTVILDNLKSGVIRPDIYDPTLNRAYADFERHYGFIADPAKVRTPQHKGIVERNIRTVKEQVIAGRQHEDIHTANKSALHWCQHEIAKRVVRTTGRTPWDLFQQEDKPALLPLPNKRFEQPNWQEAKVHKDQHIVYQHSFYSLPYTLIGEQVWVKTSEQFIKIYYQEKLIKTHPKAYEKGSWVTDKQDYPSYVAEFIEKDRETCLNEAKALGQSVYEYIEKFYRTESWTFRRKAHATLRLAETYGVDRLNQACAYALSYENFNHDGLINILKNGYDQQIIQPVKMMAEDSGYLRDPIEFDATVH